MTTPTVTATVRRAGHPSPVDRPGGRWLGMLLRYERQLALAWVLLVLISTAVAPAVLI